MHKNSSIFSVSYFRGRILACLVLVIFSFSFLPSVSLAQQPTATISDVNIENVQLLLQQLGYDPGPVDGIMGRKTAAAIKQFQQDMSLPVDGEPSTELLELLTKEIARSTGPTATISAVSGTVLVNGQEQGIGMVLIAGDIIETQAGASVVLEFSDGSQIELGENTKLDIAELAQTATGARVSRVKIMWGWIRAKLSPGHQQAGSSFDIETPNALVGVKFSQPDVEVSYDPNKQETVGLARTVALSAKNLMTNEEVIVPVGSTVIITTTTIKIIAGFVSFGTAKSETIGTEAPEAGITETETAGTDTTGAEAAQTEAVEAKTATGTGGMNTKTMVIIGAGALAAAGGLAVAAGSGDGDGSDGSSGGTNDGSGGPFTGRFVAEYVIDQGLFETNCTDVFNLIQNGTSVNGTFSCDCGVEYYSPISCDCTLAWAVPVTGSANGTSAILPHPSTVGTMVCPTCPGFDRPWPVDAGNFQATLLNGDSLLRVYHDSYGSEPVDFLRQ